MRWSPSCEGRAPSPSVHEAALCTPQSLHCPFIVPITGMGSLLCWWLGTEWGEWRTWCFWANCKRPFQLELPSWLSSASSHPRSREHNRAKWQQTQWVAGGLLFQPVNWAYWRDPGQSSGSDLPQGAARLCASQWKCTFLHSQRAEPAEGQTRGRPLGATH